MNFAERAFRYLFRKKGKAIILFWVLLITETMIFAYGHLPRPSGPRSPARQGHIKRPVLRLAGQRFLHLANQCC